MANKLTVFVDSDGVLANLSPHWTEQYNARYNDNLTEEQLMGTWDGMANIVKPECGEKIYDFLYEPGFFQSVRPFEGAVEAFKDLVDNPRVATYVLSAYSGAAEAAKGKVEWFNTYMPFFDTENLILCKPKFLLRGDVLIDDSFKNCIEYIRASYTHAARLPITLMMAAVHNQEHQYDYFDYEITARPDSFVEAVSIVQELLL